MQYTFLLICSFAALSTIGQVKQTGKYTAEQRFAKYPFKGAAQIKIGSFWIKTGTKNFQESISIPKKDGIVSVDKFDDIKTLTLQQADSLSDVLYNTFYRSENKKLSESRCYEPRNAILFLDKSDNIYAYIEICFECTRIKTSDNKVFLEEMCDETYKGLHDFFLNHGVITSMDELPDN